MSIPRRIKRRAVACVSAVILSLSPTSQWVQRAYAAIPAETGQQVPESEAPAVQVPENPKPEPAPAPAPPAVATPEPPSSTEEPTQETPVSTEEATQEPPVSTETLTPEPTAERTPAPVQPPPSASSQPSEPSATQEDAPQNAAEVSGFSSGYARVLGGTSIYTQAHDRPASKEILHLGGDEIVLVGGRSAYIPPKGEEAPDAPDWFTVTVWDGEGSKVSGYVPGTALMPLSAEELLAQEQAWQLDPEASPRDGIPQVGGLYMPPQNDDAQPVETMMPTDTLIPETTPSPLEDLEPEATTDPDATPFPWDFDSTPTPEPTPEPSPGPLVDILADVEDVPGVDVMQSAQALLDLPFDGTSIMAAALTAQDPDTTPPKIQSILQTPQEPTKPGMAKVVAVVLDEADPASPFAEVSGVERVVLTYLGGTPEVEMFPTGQANTYAALVYGTGPVTIHGFTVTATDAAGNAVTSDPFGVTIDGNTTSDTQAPFITNAANTPSGGEVDEVLISCNAEDLPNGTEDVSGLAIVRVCRTKDADGNAVSDPWYTMEYNKETARFELQVILNGTYQIEAQDWAGNVATNDISIRNIRAVDTWPPVIEWAHLSNTDKYIEYLVVRAKVYDEQNPNDSKERISGVADVSIAPFYYEDEETGKPIYGELTPFKPWTNEDGDPDLYAVTIYESGIYIIVATDEAGNVSTHILEITNIGMKPVGTADPNYVPQKDDDGDGMLTQSEYRLGYNPSLWDTNGDGISDGLEVLLGIDYQNMLEDPTPSLLSKQGSGFLQNLQKEGVLGEAIAEDNQANARASYNSRWSSARNVLCWWNPRNGQMAVVSSNAVLRMEMQSNEKPKVLGALSFYALGLGKAGNNTPRTLQCTDDGTMALVYDRDAHGGLLRGPAYLVDLLEMVGYTIPNAEGARDIRLSDDGKQLAVLRKNSLEIVNLATGAVWQTKNRAEVNGVDMLHFLPNGHLVTRVTPLGYSAYLPEGEPEVGDTISLPLIKKYQDITQITMYDLEGKPFSMHFQALMRTAGVFVTSEDEKVKTDRHMAPSRIVMFAQGLMDGDTPAATK